MGSVQSIEDMTSDLGVNVLMDCRLSTGNRTPCGYIASFGRVVEVVSESNALNTELPSARSANNLTFAQYNLPEIIYQRPSRIGKLFAGVCKLIFDGQLRPFAPARVFQGSEVEQAFGRFHEGGHVTQRIIEFASNCQVSVRNPADSIP